MGVLGLGFHFILKSDFDVQPVYELVSMGPTKWCLSQPKIIHP